MTRILHDIAKKLDEAVLSRQTIDSLRTGDNVFSLEEAYEIQKYGIQIREARGEKVVGVKLGFTSRAKMQQMGVDHLIAGVLTDSMRLEEGGKVDLSRFIHPRVEPEICFITKKDIDRTLTLAEARLAIEGVAPAMEIIDSRYNQFKFSLEDVVADNTSSAGFIIGDLYHPDTIIDNCGVILSVNGRPLEVGSTAAILGKPLRSLVQVSTLLEERGEVLPAGSIILAGAATAAIALGKNQTIDAEIQGFERITFYT